MHRKIMDIVWTMRRAQGKADRFAFGAMLCAYIFLLAINIVTLPTQSGFKLVTSCVMIPIWVTLIVWTILVIRRPFKSTQDQVIATAMLLGMELKGGELLRWDDKQTSYKEEYYADVPDNYLRPFEILRRVYGKTPYDVAAQWLRYVEH